MKAHISTDFTPKTVGVHKRENWESPIMDKYNNAHDFLLSLDIDGEFSCKFDSSSQMFSPIIDECNGLLKEKIDSIINKLNEL